MLWLCLYCPDSLLESLLAATPDMAGAAVVSETIRGCERVQSANAQARKQGVQVGMKLAAAYALDDSLVVYPYQASVAQHTQRELACWAMQYTSYVSIGANQTILLEVSGSLTLFGGIEALYQRVAADLETDFGYQCAISVAPTPLGATWLALANKACVVDSIAGLHRALKPLPIKVLRLEPKLEKALYEMGIRQLSDLLSLPRDSLIRRFGDEILLLKDKALGVATDSPEAFVPEEVYHQILALPFAVKNVEAISFVANRLVQSLVRFLLARWQGLLALEIRLCHEHEPNTVLTWELTQPSRDAEHLLRIIKTRLDKTALPEAVTDIEIYSDKFERLKPQQVSMFADKEPKTPWPLLVDYLKSRLGEHAVFGIKPVTDHRPEHAWGKQAPGEACAVERAPVTRPAWLLPKPKNLGQVLPKQYALWQGPERLEGGWWDDEDISRDYYIAVEGDDRLVWLYWDNKTTKQWFLHGVFS